jgi:hypothetical protein
MASYNFQLISGAKGGALEHSLYVARKGHYKAKADLVLSGHGNFPDWAGGSPAVFWAAADAYERANGAAYRELIIALPNELVGNALLPLVEDLIRSLVGLRPYQYAVHSRRSSLQGTQNPHVHIMYSDRMPDGIERSPNRTFSRFNPHWPERGGCRKADAGRTWARVHEDMLVMRKRAADIQNAHLARHGHDVRVDHRSLREQGVLRTPERHLGPGFIQRMSATEKDAYVQARASAESSRTL